MIITKKLLLILLLTSAFNITHAQLTKELDMLFKDFVEREKFSGVVLIADLQGNTVYESSVGLADERFEVPNSQDVKFDIASISKQFTAALILKLNQDSLIDLQASISSYLPDYRKDTGEKVKVIDLLTHKSGIPNYTSLPRVWLDSLRNHYTFNYLVSQFCSGDLEFEPGSKYKYNNSGYVILAAIVEAIYDTSFEEVIQERLLEPLGLKETGISSREKLISQKAYGYVDFNGELRQANYMYMQNLNGAGSMYATARDLVKWTNLLHGNKVLSKSSYQLMTKPYSTDNKWIAPFKNSYGFGLGMYNSHHVNNTTNEWNTTFHSGHIAGFSSFLVTYKQDGLVVVLLSNRGNISTIEMNNISKNLLEAYKANKSISSGK